MYTNVFIVNPEEFNLCISIEEKKFYEEHVFIIWKWKWVDSPIDSSIEQEQLAVDLSDGSIKSDDDSHDDSDSSLVMHSVVFKCMGANIQVSSFTKSVVSSC